MIDRITQGGDMNGSGITEEMSGTRSPLTGLVMGCNDIYCWIMTKRLWQNPSPFWLKPFPVRTCTVFFPFTSFSGFVLSKFYNPVCSFSFFPMARASDGTDVPVSLVPASSSTMVVRTVLFLTLMRQDFAPVRWRRKSTKMFVQIAKLPLLMQSISRFEKLRPNALPDSGVF